MRKHHKFISGLATMLIFSFLVLMQPATARAQKRVSDKDVERMIKNLRYDTKNFRPMFDRALNKSTIRKTSQAKDAKNLGATFQNQVDRMMVAFKKNRNDGTAVADAVHTAAQIDSLLQTVSLGSEVMTQWQKIRAELQPIAESYGIQESYRDNSANGTATDASVACLQSAGPVKADRLVNECLQVSPATHPPCNAQNTCSLIISEIRRGCSMLGSNAPGFCADYRDRHQTRGLAG